MVIDTNKLPDLMPRVARMVGAGASMQDVLAELRNSDLTEYSIFVTIKGAAMCYPHVQEALSEDLPPTEPSPIR